MLYLMRKLDESVIINGSIEVKVIEVKGKAVKLGFDFPETASVLRKEVHERIVAENQAARMSDAWDEALSGMAVPAPATSSSDDAR